MTIILLGLVNRIIAHLSRLGLSNHWRLIIHLWILKLINLWKIIVFRLSRLGLVNLWKIIVVHLSRLGLVNLWKIIVVHLSRQRLSSNWRLTVHLNRIRPELNGWRRGFNVNKRLDYYWLKYKLRDAQISKISSVCEKIRVPFRILFFFSG